MQVLRCILVRQILFFIILFCFQLSFNFINYLYHQNVAIYNSLINVLIYIELLVCSCLHYYYIYSPDHRRSVELVLSSNIKYLIGPFSASHKTKWPLQRTGPPSHHSDTNGLLHL